MKNGKGLTMPNNSVSEHIDSLSTELERIKEKRNVLRDIYTLDDVPEKEYQKLQEKDDIITSILNSFNSLPVGRV